VLRHSAHGVDFLAREGLGGRALFLAAKADASQQLLEACFVYEQGNPGL